MTRTVRGQSYDERCKLGHSVLLWSSWALLVLLSLRVSQVIVRHQSRVSWQVARLDHRAGSSWFDCRLHWSHRGHFRLEIVQGIAVLQKVLRLGNPVYCYGSLP
jgi:hypothetical protein